MRNKIWRLMLCASLLLAACGRSDTETPTATLTPEIVATEVIPAATPEPVISPTPKVSTVPSPSSGAIPAEVALSDEIALVQHENEIMNIHVLVPDGWQEVSLGVFRRSAGDPVTLIQQSAPGTTLEQLKNGLQLQLGIDSLPESQGTREGAGLTWDLYSIALDAPGLGIIQVEVALAWKDEVAYLIILQALPEEMDRLREAVFIPAVDNFIPLDTETAELRYHDPAGRFSVPIPTNWTAEEQGDYATLLSPDGLFAIHVLAFEAENLVSAIDEAWLMVDPAFSLEHSDVIDEPAPNGADRVVTIVYDTGENEETLVIGGGWLVEGVAYVELFVTDVETYQKRVNQAGIVSTGFEIAALEQIDLSAVEPLDITSSLLAELENYVEEKMRQLDVPGAAIAIVRDGELVYSNGFGVRDLVTGEPVTPETMMMVGSSSKSLTTLLMAQLVDEGYFEWDTPVVGILPSFEVADADLTQEITMRNLVCACSGVPRRDIEWLFNANSLTAEDVIASLANFEFFTDFGEAFQYSNQMVASGGYIAALAAGAEYGSLHEAYIQLMEERIIEPIGMPDTTYSFDEVAAGGNVATPYGRNILGENLALPLSTEALLVPMAPAGALWSNVLDMSDYLLVQLGSGVAPDGTRIVSAENLAITWEPQVAISADADYGLGWIIEDYDGVKVIDHGGNTFGFTSEVAFLPDHHIGISILTNQQNSMLNQVVRFWLLEKLFQNSPQIEEILAFQLEMVDQANRDLRANYRSLVNLDDVEYYLGEYHHDTLGDISLLWEEGTLLMDVGEFTMEIWSHTGEDNYLTATPPLAGMPLELAQDDQGNPIIIFGLGVVEYTFERSS